MSDLYSNIHALCEKEGIKDGTLCGRIGIRRSFLSELKAGRTKSLSAENLSKIASYFGVSVDELLNGKQKESLPAKEADRQDVIDYLRKRFSTMSEEEKAAESSDILRFLGEELKKQNK